MKFYGRYVSMVLIGVVTTCSLLAASSSLNSSVAILDQALGDTCHQTSTAATPLSCSGEWTTFVTSGNNTVTFGGSAYAAAGFGLLHSGSLAVASCYVQPGVSCYGHAGDVASDASFLDLVTISGAPSSGFLALSVVAEGNNQLTCVGTYATTVCGNSASTGASLSVYGGSALVNGVRQAGTGLNSGSNDVSVWIPFASTGGIAQVTVGLGLDTTAVCWVADDTTCSGHSIFSDTAYVAGLRILDASGNPVSGISLIADSGTDYNNIQVPSPAPESSSLVLLSVGLLSAAGFRLASIKRK